MESTYILNVGYFQNNQYKDITKIMNQESNGEHIGAWSYIIKSDSESDNTDFINIFLDLLEGKYKALKEIGIEKDSITVWFLYGYEYQCNLEFDSQDLKRLGDNGIKLCISCYDVGEYSDDDES